MGSFESMSLAEEETNYDDEYNSDPVTPKFEFDDIIEKPLTGETQQIIQEYPVYQFFIKSIAYILSKYENKEGSHRCEVQLDAKIRNSKKEWMNIIKKNDKLIEIRDAKSRIRQAFNVKTINDLKYYHRIGKIYGYLIMFEYFFDDCFDDFNYIYEMIGNTEIKEDDTNVFDYVLLGIISILAYAEIPNDLDPLHDEKEFKIICYLSQYMKRKIDNIEIVTEIIDIIISKIKKLYNQYVNINLCNLCIDMALQYFVFDINLNKPFYILSKSIKYCYDFIEPHYMQSIFNISIKYFQNVKTIQYPIAFWEKIAKYEREINPQNSRNYILGLIPFVIEPFILPLFPLLYHDFLNNIENDLFKIIKHFLNELIKAESSIMFKILEKYYSQHIKDSKPENKFAALFALLCITSCQSENILLYFQKKMQVLKEFSYSKDIHIKILTISLIKRFVKYNTSVLLNNEYLSIFYQIIESNLESSEEIILVCFKLLSLMLTYSNHSSLIFDKINEIYRMIISLINKKFNDNVYDAIFEPLKILFINSPKRIDAYLLSISDEIFKVIEAGAYSKSYSTIYSNFLFLIPIITQRLKEKVSCNLAKISISLIRYFQLDTPLYDEIFTTFVNIIPLYEYDGSFKCTSMDFFNSCILPLYKNIMECHQRNDPHIVKLTSKLLSQLFMQYPNFMSPYFEEVFNLIVKDVKSTFILRDSYPYLFDLLSNMINSDSKTFEQFQQQINSILIEQIYYQYDFSNEIEKELNSSCISSVLNVYLSLYKNSNDQEFLKTTQNNLILFLKKIGHNPIIINEKIISCSVYLIFYLMSSKGSRIYTEIKNSSLYTILSLADQSQDENISAGARIIIKILENYK